MKKIFVLLALLAVVYFGLRKWSPQTLDRLAFWRKSAPATNVPFPAMEPAPTPAAAGSTPAKGSASATAPDNAATKPTSEPVAVDRTAQVVTFCYHRLEGPSAGLYSITPELFEQHMQRIKDGGISVISMQDFLAWRRGEKSIPAKSALITLDDGYVSAFEVARPILKKFGYPWTYFVYTNYIGRGGKSISWEQLEVLRDEGIEIGSHTISHQDLREVRGRTPEAYEAWLREEILGSKKQLEQRLGIRCTVFAYPVGGWNSKIIELIHEGGFAAAFTVFGQRLTFSAPAERLGRYAWDNKRPQDLELAFRFSGGLSPSTESTIAPGQAAPALLSQPADGESISDPRPTLKANLAVLGELDPASVGLRLSGIGLIPCKFDPESKNVEARPPQALQPGEYSVTVTAKSHGKRIETQWHFRFDPASAQTHPSAPDSVAPGRH